MKTVDKIRLVKTLSYPVNFLTYLFTRKNTVTVNRGGINWDLDLTQGIDFSIWLLGSFEPKTVKSYQRLIKKGDIVLDIGANIGSHTLFMARCVGENGKVLAFEPTDYAFNKLKRNCELNPELSSRVKLFQTMLVDKEFSDEVPQIYSSWPLTSKNNLHDLHLGEKMSTNGAGAETLDVLLKRENINNVNFIKMDVDGFECKVLRGAKNTLSKYHPIIIMELAPYLLEEQGEKLSTLLNLLKECGYSLYAEDTRKIIIMDHEYLSKAIRRGESWNVLASTQELN